MLQNFIQQAIASVPATAKASGLYSSLCTIQAPSGVFGATGAPDGNYVNVAGRVNLSCQRAAPSVIRITAGEVRTQSDIEQTLADHVAFPAYYPDLESAAALGYQAVIDGVTYTILGAEVDSQHQLTRMEVQLVRV